MRSLLNKGRMSKFKALTTLFFCVSEGQKKKRKRKRKKVVSCPKCRQFNIASVSHLSSPLARCVWVCICESVQAVKPSLHALSHYMLSKGYCKWLSLSVCVCVCVDIWNPSQAFSANKSCYKVCENVSVCLSICEYDGVCADPFYKVYLQTYRDQSNLLLHKMEAQ